MPIALTLKAKNKNINIDFYCFNRDTEEAIKNNTVLYDIIKSVGRLKRIGDYRNSFLPNIFKKIYLFFNLILLVFSNYIFKCKYVHFGALEKWPLNILYYFMCPSIILHYLIFSLLFLAISSYIILSHVILCRLM